jgi:hypothetical protein
MCVPEISHSHAKFCLNLTPARLRFFAAVSKREICVERKAEEIRNQHLGFAASMTSTLPHFRIMHFFFNELVDMVG